MPGDQISEQIRAARSTQAGVEVQQALADARRALLGEEHGPVTLDRYVLSRRLGSGGSGVVFTATDPVLERKVAIKLIDASREFQDPGDEARLLREARGLAALSHPNIVPVFDVGTYDRAALGRLSATQGRELKLLGEGVFLVMELIEGPTLAQWLQQPRSWREATTNLVAAGRGLAAAHARGLVHRDFKPANVLLGEDGRPRVVDFGLARRRGAPRVTDAGDAPGGQVPDDITIAGTIVGTPAYMAPEQHAGTTTDARCDQFSFCVTLYEALYGQRPYRGDSIDALHDAKLAGPPAPPEHRVPAVIVRAMLRGLAPEPADRFGSMDDLLAELDHDFARSRRLTIGVSALVVAAGGGALSMQWLGEADPPCPAVRLSSRWAESRDAVREAFTGTERPFAPATFEHVDELLARYADDWGHVRTAACRAREEAQTRCLHRQAVQFEALVELFAEADATTVERAPSAVSHLPDTDSCADAEALRLAVAPPPDAVAEEVAHVDDLLARAAASRYAGRGEHALALVEEAEAVARPTDYAPAVAEALEGRGTMLAALGRYEEATEILREGVLQAKRGDHKQIEAELWATLSFVVGFQLAKHERGLEYADLAESMLGVAEDPGRLELELTYSRGMVLTNAADYGRAVEVMSKALAVGERILPEGDPEIATLLSGLGIAQRRAGDLAGARASFERGLQLIESRFGPEHPAARGLLVGVANTLFNEGHHAEALPLYRRLLTAVEASLPAGHPHIADVKGNIGATLHALGRDEEAEAVLREALGEVEDGARLPGRGEILHNMGVVMLALGRRAEARRYLERAVELRTELLGADHPLTAGSRKQLAELDEGRP